MNRPRMAGAPASWFRRALLWGLWPLLFAPATIVLHEIGHLLTALALGFPDPVLHFSAISHGDVGDRPAWQSGLVGLAGPAVTALLVLFAIGWTRWRRPARWAFGLAVAAVSRFFVGVPYTIANLIARAAGRRLDPPSFDEYKAGAALALPGDLVLGASSLLFLLVLVWLLFSLPRGERATAWLGLLGGTVLGWGLWFGLIGPALFP